MNRIVTISRQFGSGGRELGKRLADALGVAYFDREIIASLAQRSGLSEKYLERISERGVPPHYPITYGRTFSLHPAVSKLQTEVLVEQRKVLEELAEAGDCVIVGRCADVVLKEYQPLNLFVYAELESRLRRCQSREAAPAPLSEAEMIKRIKQVDRQRAGYRAVLTNTKWGDMAAYHLCVNTTGLEIKALIPTALAYYSCYFQGGNL